MNWRRSSERAARAALERERDRASERVSEAEAEIFDAHIQFLDDSQITDGVESAIEDESYCFGMLDWEVTEDGELTIWVR